MYKKIPLYVVIIIFLLTAMLTFQITYVLTYNNYSEKISEKVEEKESENQAFRKEIGSPTPAHPGLCHDRNASVPAGRRAQEYC